MKLRLSLGLVTLLVLTACGNNQPAPAPAATSAPVATTAPEVKPTNVPPTQPPTTVPPTNTTVPATAAPTATEPPAAPAATPLPQPTEIATAAPTAAGPRPTATSAGPLAAAIYVANCRSVPTTDKPGGVIVQISIEATGGNGQYHYFYKDKEYPTKFIEVPGEKGTHIIDRVRVTSGGQDITKEFDIAISTLTCP